MGRMSDMVIDDTETPIMVVCPECDGEGYIEYEVPRPQGFGRDVGYIDTETEVCETCDGDGEIERLCECGEPVTRIMGDDATECEECAA
jgi:DnaJ-class molecular chaperone